MTAVILTIHSLIVLGLIVVVLLQRSDGGALGIGGGSGGGFMTGRSAANALTRTTSVLAALFFATSLGLAILAGSGEDEQSVIEGLTGEALPDPSAESGEVSTDDLLRSLGADEAPTEGDEAEAPAEADAASEESAASDVTDAATSEEPLSEAVADEDEPGSDDDQ